jgi:hypothetical protein
MCADGDLYYVKVTCFHPDDEEPTLWSGNVELNDDPGYEVSIGFDNTDFADSEGDLNTHKTELSFKGEGQGPGYKPHPQGKHSQYPAVNVEIEFEEGDSPLCE